MGFPNQGLSEILPKIRGYSGSTPLGVNIGKNKDTSAAESITELSTLYESLGPQADYFVINVSSPNTPGLRALQEKSYLTDLFTEMNRIKRQTRKDLYLKIAPDLPAEKIVEIAELAQDFQLTGLIATNTTISPERGTGGMSGALLTGKAREVRKLILQQDLELELIGVGGIMGVQDLFDFWLDGGKAAQVYTGYIYHGPHLLAEFKNGVERLLRLGQLKTLEAFFSLDLQQRGALLRAL
jgi:dihydroorotate dehydrogenase